ncbi:uncharacterized protein LOC108248668 [Kryptolebias marmoratus]|uniref:uncharacterized protein LOC108248668 n=1 Tax=Kryptolebias marmoratus TaxID=37003 RepID=UPI0007F87987|nr:uncharacterized protein LOC108248668 [Kryptolebias marmoratus]
MGLTLLLTSLCCWTAAARYIWTDIPKLILSSEEINDGDNLTIGCTVPIDYTGGDCRLFRGHSHDPFKMMTASSYDCEFHLTSDELLGGALPDRLVPIRCDYKLQDFTSKSSDRRRIMVWGTKRWPSLSISSHFVSLDDSIEVTCTPPVSPASDCWFYRNQYGFVRGSCSRNITGREIVAWMTPGPVVSANLTCTYNPTTKSYIRSEHSLQLPVFILDASRATSSVECEVSVSDKELQAFRDTRYTTVGENGLTVTVQVTSGNLTLGRTCN